MSHFDWRWHKMKYIGSRQSITSSCQRVVCLINKKADTLRIRHAFSMCAYVLGWYPWH